MTGPRRARKRSTPANPRSVRRQRQRPAVLVTDPEQLPIGIAAAQMIILPNPDDTSPLERQLWHWLPLSTTTELDGLSRWLSRTAPTWIRRAVPAPDQPAALHQLDRLTDDVTAARTARATAGDIRDTWNRLMREQPIPRPSDALTAARGIHA